jgi:glycosyltransferase involved in cell wall biosynthesis
MTVTYFQRRAYDNAFSVEQVFSDVRHSLPPFVKGKVLSSRYASRGFLRRLYNSIEAALSQGEINHITGDVHFLACFLHKKNTILTVHDCGGLHRLSGVRREMLKLLWYTIPCRRSALITTISEFTRSELIRYTGCPPEKVRVIPDPVGLGFLPSPQLFNHACPAILFVGMTPNKNLERAAAALRGIPCRLQIVGALSASQKAVLEANGINWSAKAKLSNDEIVAAYRNCDFLLFPSTYEGFGLPIIEAQATGRPVVTSKVCSMPEVAGAGARLVDPFDVNSIREGVLEVIGDAAYRRRLIENGFRNVSRFSAETIARQYVDLYEELARGKAVQAERDLRDQAADAHPTGS